MSEQNGIFPEGKNGHGSEAADGFHDETVIAAVADQSEAKQSGRLNQRRDARLQHRPASGSSWLFFALFCFSSSLAMGADPFEVSLADLMKMEVVSPSKRAQSFEDVPAAIFVISAEEIRRSGAMTVPEALRLAPGVEVQAISQNRWSVSIRGGAREYANKLQVLVDGRSVYHPVFSGVVWEALGVPIEEIKRIEVIRGPGASIWGSNAVNGVINIITFPAKESQGGKLNLAGGSDLRDSAYYRYGYEPSENSAAKIYAKGFEFLSTRQSENRSGEDFWTSKTVGFRVDRTSTDRTRRFCLQGSAGAYKAQDAATMHSRPPTVESLAHTENIESLNVTAKWEKDGKAGDTTTWQTSFERALHAPILLEDRRNTLDIEFNHQLAPRARQKIIWGAGVRVSQDNISNSKYMRVSEQEHLLRMYRAFFNDDITLRPKRLNLLLSGSLEHNDTTGFEFQPTVRLMLTPGEKDHIWIGGSRAARTPSRVEQVETKYYYLASPLPPAPFILDTLIRDIKSEELKSFECGWRRFINKSLTVDLTGFWFNYRNVLSTRLISMLPDPAGYLLAEQGLYNEGSASSRGYEASLDWKPTPKWRVQTSFRTMEMFLDYPQDSTPLDIRESVPNVMFSTCSNLELNRKLFWSLWYRKSGSVKEGNLPGYETVDTTLSCKTGHKSNLSLVAQNVFDKKRQEFSPRFIFSIPREFGRRVFLTSEWFF